MNDSEIRKRIREIVVREAKSMTLQAENDTVTALLSLFSEVRENEFADGRESGKQAGRSLNAAKSKLRKSR